MFASQSAPKVLDLNEEIIFIIGNDEPIIRNDEPIIRSESQILYFQNNYSKLALNNYTKGLQHSFPHSVNTSCPILKKSQR